MHIKNQVVLVTGGARGEGVARDAAKSRYWARKARESRARGED